MERGDDLPVTDSKSARVVVGTKPEDTPNGLGVSRADPPPPCEACGWGFRTPDRVEPHSTSLHEHIARLRAELKGMKKSFGLAYAKYRDTEKERDEARAALLKLEPYASAWAESGCVESKLITGLAQARRVLEGRGK